MLLSVSHTITFLFWWTPSKSNSPLVW